MSTTLTGYEALSRPFRYVLEYYPAEQPELAALIGKPYTVRLPMPDGSTRPLNGIVFRAEQGRPLCAPPGIRWSCARGSCALIRNAPALSSKI